MRASAIVANAIGGSHHFASAARSLRRRTGDAFPNVSAGAWRRPALRRGDGMSADWFYIAGSLCFLIGTIINMVNR